MTQPDSDEIRGAAIDIVDPDEMQEIVAAFVVEVTGYIEAIKKAMRESDFQTIGRLGHTIKGDSMAVGLDDIAKIGASIEQAGKVQKTETIPTLLSHVETQLEQVRKSLG